MWIRASNPRFAVLVGVAVMIVVSCTSPDPGRPRVVAVGDSLMVLATANIQRELAPDHDETIIARNGQRIDEMLPPLRRALRDNAPVDAVVLNLGTNNLLQADTYEGTLADFERMITLTEGVPCVVLTTISTYIDDWRATTVGAEINAQIRALVAKDTRQYQVADWDAAVRAPGGVERLLVGSDGAYDVIHENDGAGLQWFADEYDKALSRCPGPDRP